MHLLHRTAIIATLKRWARFAASFPSSLIRPSLRAVNCRCMRKLCLPFYFMAVNFKFSPLRRSQGSILFTIRFCDKSFKLKALITIGSFTPPRGTVPMNGLFQWILALPCLPSCPPVSWYPVSVFLSSDCVTSVIFGHILRHFEALEHRIIFHTSHALRRLSSPFRLGRPRAHWPEIALSEAFHRSEQLRRNQKNNDIRNGMAPWGVNMACSMENPAVRSMVFPANSI